MKRERHLGSAAQSCTGAAAKVGGGDADSDPLLTGRTLLPHGVKPYLSDLGKGMLPGTAVPTLQQLSGGRISDDLLFC
jgi:hypothetical protein